MAKHSHWQDEYWLLLIQMYLKQPTGIKPTYYKPLVDLSLELHIPPKELGERMFQLRRLDTPRLERLWNTFAENPKKLQRAVKLLKDMSGFGNANAFYEGVEVNESWERDFRQIPGRDDLKPVMLIMVLDLYFRLVPITMVADTPEVVELARLMRIKPSVVADILQVFIYCDPFRKADEMFFDPLLPYCQEVWERFGNARPQALAAEAALLKEYFRR